VAASRSGWRPSASWPTWFSARRSGTCWRGPSKRWPDSSHSTTPWLGAGGCGAAASKLLSWVLITFVMSVIVDVRREFKAVSLAPPLDCTNMVASDRPPSWTRHRRKSGGAVKIPLEGLGRGTRGSAALIMAEGGTPPSPAFLLQATWDPASGAVGVDVEEPELQAMAARLIDRLIHAFDDVPVLGQRRAVKGGLALPQGGWLREILTATDPEVVMASSAIGDSIAVAMGRIRNELPLILRPHLPPWLGVPREDEGEEGGQGEGASSPQTAAVEKGVSSASSASASEEIIPLQGPEDIGVLRRELLACERLRTGAIQRCMRDFAWGVICGVRGVHVAQAVVAAVDKRIESLRSNLVKVGKVLKIPLLGYPCCLVCSESQGLSVRHSSRPKRDFLLSLRVPQCTLSRVGDCHSGVSRLLRELHKRPQNVDDVVALETYLEKNGGVDLGKFRRQYGWVFMLLDFAFEKNWMTPQVRHAAALVLVTNSPRTNDHRAYTGRAPVQVSERVYTLHDSINSFAKELVSCKQLVQVERSRYARDLKKGRADFFAAVDAMDAVITRLRPRVVTATTLEGQLEEINEVRLRARYRDRTEVLSMCPPEVEHETEKKCPQEVEHETEKKKSRALKPRCLSCR
jgi:hypothetical protein